MYLVQYALHGIPLRMQTIFVHTLIYVQYCDINFAFYCFYLIPMQVQHEARKLGANKGASVGISLGLVFLIISCFLP